MAYHNLCEALATDCERITWFSDPRVYIRGTDRAIGVPAGTDTTCRGADIGHYRCDADNVRTFYAMAGVVARFRASRSTRVPGRTFPPTTLDFTCHGYVETRGTRAYNCIPAPEQQHHMRTFVPPPGSPCDQGQVITTSDQPDRIVFQIRCRDSRLSGAQTSRKHRYQDIAANQQIGRAVHPVVGIPQRPLENDGYALGHRLPSGFGRRQRDTL